MTQFEKLAPPAAGEPITASGGQLQVPDQPIIPFIEGDGIGPDIWRASQRVFDGAVEIAYGGKRGVAWYEIYAGLKAIQRYDIDSVLPEDTLNAIRSYLIAIKGPLTTPVGGFDFVCLVCAAEQDGPEGGRPEKCVKCGSEWVTKRFRSINVGLRQKLDLYACVRPVRWFEGVPSPVKRPDKLDVVIFRENTEDVYSGIEFQGGSAEAKKLIDYLGSELGKKLRPDSGVGIKPISVTGTRRLVKKAIEYALANGRESVTLVHKGNIMKFTEGAFRDWGYDLAREEYRDRIVTEKELWDDHDGHMPNGKLLVKDRIADSIFQQVLLRPDEYEVLATPNLNGDYLSDACAAQVGGLGMAPGANLGDEIGLFEATHGTAPKYTGQDKVNPSSVILSGALMFRHIGWREAADLIETGIEKTIEQKRVTYDLERQMEGATKLKTSEYGAAIVENMRA